MFRRSRENSAIKEPNKVLNSDIKECSSCAGYHRQLEEIQQNLSGREQIIEVLQSQHTDLQQRYKDLLEECERLRLERSELVRDSLYFKERENLKLCCKCRTQDQAVQNSSPNKIRRCTPTIDKTSISKNNKDDLLKDIINKILNELKNCKCLNEQDMQNIAEALNGRPESMYENTPNICQNNSKSAPCLNQTTYKPTDLPNKNSFPGLCRDTIKNDSSATKKSIPKGVQCSAPCSESKAKVTQCEAPCKETKAKTTQCEASCNPTVSKSVSNANMGQNEMEELASELIRRELAFSECKCKFAQQISDLTGNNDMLAETLEVVNEENKANIQKICQLSGECKNLSAEYEKYMCEAKCAMAALENELEECTANEQRLITTFQNEKVALCGIINKLEHEIEELKADVEEYKRCDDIQCNKIFTLNEKVQELTHEKQRLEDENADLIKQIRLLEEDNKFLESECAKFEKLVKNQEDEIQELNDALTTQSDKMNAIQQEVLEKQEENNDLRNKLAECNAKLKAFEDQCKCDEMLNEIQKLRAENCKKQAIICELEKTVNNFNNLMKQCEQNVDELSQENETLNADLKKLREYIETLKEQFRVKSQDLLDENAQLENALAECKRDRQEVIDKNKKLDRENKLLADDLEEARQANLSLLNQMDQLKQIHCQNMTVMGGDIRKLSETIKTYEQQLNDLENRLKTCEDREKSYIQQINNIKELNCKLKSEVAQKDSELQKLRKSLEDANKLAQEISGKESELCEVTKKYDECKSNCKAKCAENHQLKQKLDQANCQCTSLFDTVERLEKVLADLQQSYDRKCEELDELKQRYSESLCKCKQLMDKKKENEKDVYDWIKRYKELEQAYDDRTNELKKLRKQCESCTKQSQISREEYNNLKKEYKDIKSMLADQIQKYKLNTDDLEQTTGGGCKVLSSLKQKLLEKEQQIAALQKKSQDATYEIIELKDYVHKLISDNNILKSAINNLIDNLESKIKGSNIGTTTSCVSTEVIAGQILQSLTFMEHDMAQKNQSCPVKECKCTKQSQLKKNDCTSSCPGCRETKGSSTDSDDCQCFDKRSLDVLKEALSELKERKQLTMSAKSCECKQDLPNKDTS